MKFKNLLFSLGIALLGGVAAVFIYARLVGYPENQAFSGQSSSPSVYYAALTPQDARDVAYPDFTFAAERTVNCVVHVKVKTMQNMYSGSGNPFFDFFYGYREQRQVPREGFGSGVIITDDGYIITNNHVIDKADEIEVTLNDKRVFTAKLVGADPTTDLALLKIEESGLPHLTYGDSEALRVGEWVLAVGNPYNLTSTVTAGIVSAKTRQLGILANSTQMGIESFIQTDAAVNPGNSGGALVNTKGELVGINTAIASQTGSFSGNSFAIPVSIVQKVILDLKEFGVVQRAMLGIGTREIDAEFAKEKGLDKIEGIYVASVMETGGAAAAGIKEGDIIKSINGISVNSFSQLQEQLSKYRPNDHVDVTIERNKKTQQIQVTLRNIEETTQISNGDSSSILGAKFEGINDRDKRTLRIRSGIKVTDVGNGKLKEAGVRNGFIVTRINDQPVSSISDFQSILNKIEPGGRIIIDGIYPNGKIDYYGFAK
ncbi:MAG: Do family serine endopeptidase [Bacteroidales bacterium]|jgi:Do/DeqQ family serine protease|nr:Do family serine endopeptidase [Bacteroidales bacterium]